MVTDAERVAFVRAHLDEDERAFQDAVEVQREERVPGDPHPWVLHVSEACSGCPCLTPGVIGMATARLCVEIAAKRSLLDAAERDMGRGGVEGAWAGHVIGALASTYSTHPDYPQ